MTHKQMPLLTREDLGYYSRVEMTLVLCLNTLKAQGNYRYASIRALSAFLGDRSHGMYSLVRRAKANGLVEIGPVEKGEGRGRHYVNVVYLTKKGESLVTNAIQRVTSIK